MRNFFYKSIRNLSLIYACFLVVLSYRLFYNEMYFEIHDEIQVSMSEDDLIYPLGEIVGIYTECEGIFVIDTCEIETVDGTFINPAGELVKTGDYILAINGVELKEKEDMIQMVEGSKGKVLTLTISRNNEIFSVDVTPSCAKNGTYMLGIWVKDDLAGVGTITYLKADGDFAALGHGMGDGETDDLLEVKGGDIYVTSVIGIEKGEKGNPGEVKGVIYYGPINHIGELSENSGKGIYGTLDDEDVLTYMNTLEAHKVAQKQEIQTGNAQIISDVSGSRQIYDIKITYIDYLAVNTNKGLHIQVTDPDLIELTGGIVQGMSGSPILQNGKIVGAVTHVLINDPTSGYGIFIEEMLE